MPDQVSWKVAERGWKVLDAAGNEIGYVEEILGDIEADIFDGINVRKGLLKGTEYVPAEKVTEFREGNVVIVS